MATMSGLEQASLPAGRMPDSAPRNGLDAFRLHADLTYERSLSKLIEHEIIPRLMVAHQDDADPAAGEDGITAQDIAAFTPLSLQVEADTLLEHVERLLRRGVSVDSVLVDLLAPVARTLGEMWEDDRCDFVEVTMGLWRLQEVVHELAARVPAQRHSAGGGRRALFAAMPGDQHSFGTVVVDEMFTRAGWVTDRIGESTTPQLLDRVANEWIDLVGLTVSCDGHCDNLGSIITALRTVSRNPRLCVMVGGRIFVEQPDLALSVGADGTAADARLAVAAAAVLVGELERGALDNA